MSYDALRAVMSCLAATFKFECDHIITLGEAKLITFCKAKFITVN